MQRKIAICPGSFDPVTIGHLDIIRRASKLFDNVIVVVMSNYKKMGNYSFSQAERVEMIIRCTKDMPNVVGQSLETAKTILNNQKLNLEIKQLEENSNTVAENCIIRTEPAVGEKVKTGGTVTLYVSKGPVKAKMPKVQGEDISTALKMLNAAGLVNITYDTYVESEEPKDTVVEQSVTAGDEVPVTTTIVLKLSEGPKPKETKKMVKFGLMEDALEAYPVKITRKDTGDVVFEATMAASKAEIELELSGIGKITYVVSLGGGNSYELEVDFEAE